jgi:DNA-binding response OmpR family regulator
VLCFKHTSEFRFLFRGSVLRSCYHKRMKIAIVEDDQAISMMYRIKFESEGFDVDTAENGKLGLVLIEKMKPDIVLLDLMMPEMNGEEMLRALRATDWGKSQKVVVLTNMGEQEVPESVKDMGVLAFILKADMTPRQVADLVKKLLA